MFGRKRGPMDPDFPLAAEPVSGSAVDTPATPPAPAGPAARLPASVLAAAAAAPPRPAAPPRSAVQAMMTSQPVSAPTPVPTPAPAPVCAPASAPEMASEDFLRTDTFRTLRAAVFAGINVSAAVTRSRDQVRGDLTRLVGEIVSRDRLLVTMAEQLRAVEELLNDMFGIGPIEPLLADDTVTDILVNGPDQVFVERHGRLELTPLKFRDNAHVTNVAQRIAASIGRRVDESSPMVDARLADGSRVNVVLPPLAIRGTCLSIRKFAKRNVTLHRMVMQGNLSTAMARVLEVACACRTNIIISGGTGSGKTTLMNAMSRVIDERERIITIEDAAELQLQQPHVVSLETRPEGIEGGGMVDQRQLVKNALRMRPDRIILGETRGAEAFDVLQAMNTGHDGSMTTLHANTPRDALTRLESMVLLAAGSLPLLSIRRQIASAVQMIVQLERMRDGVRRITHVTEIAGMEGDVIITQDLFTFRYDDSTYGDEVKGTYESTGLRPVFSTRASYYGLEKALMEAIQG